MVLFIVVLGNGINIQTFSAPYSKKDRSFTSLEGIVFSITENSSSEKEKVENIIDWIYQNIDVDINLDENTLPIETAEKKKGNAKSIALLFQQMSSMAGIQNEMIAGYTDNPLLSGIDSENDQKHYWNVAKVDGEMLYFDLIQGFGYFDIQVGTLTRLAARFPWSDATGKIKYRKKRNEYYLFAKNERFTGKYLPAVNASDIPGDTPFHNEVKTAVRQMEENWDTTGYTQELLVEKDSYNKRKEEAENHLRQTKILTKKIKTSNDEYHSDSLYDLRYEHIKLAYREFRRMHRHIKRAQKGTKRDNKRLRIRESKRSSSIIIKNNYIQKKYERLIKNLKLQNKKLKEQNKDLKKEIESISNVELTIVNQRSNYSVSSTNKEKSELNFQEIFQNTQNIHGLKKRNEEILIDMDESLAKSILDNKETIDSLYLYNRMLIKQSIFIKVNFTSSMLDEMLEIKDSILTNKIKIQKIKLKNLERFHTQLKVYQTDLKKNYRTISINLKKNMRLIKMNKRLLGSEMDAEIFTQEINNWINTNTGFIDNNIKTIEFNNEQIAYLKELLKKTQKENKALRKEIKFEQVRSRTEKRIVRRKFRKEKRELFFKVRKTKRLKERY